MSTEKTLHPDEKVKAGTLGKRLAGAGAAILVIFLILSIILGASKGDHWRRFFHAYVIGWSFVASIAIGSVVCIVAAIAGDTAQDLKTGHLLGATPWKQQVGEFVDDAEGISHVDVG